MALRPSPLRPFLLAAAAWLPLFALGEGPPPVREQSVEVELSVQGMT